MKKPIDNPTNEFLFRALGLSVAKTFARFEATGGEFDSHFSAIVIKAARGEELENQEVLEMCEYLLAHFDLIDLRLREKAIRGKVVNLAEWKQLRGL